MASLKQPAVGFNLGQSTGETSFEDDLPNYENWQANNPAPFLDLLDNIYDYLENHCIKRYNHVAKDKYLHEMLDISKYLVVSKSAKEM